VVGLPPSAFYFFVVGLGSVEVHLSRMTVAVMAMAMKAL
jgi:hypothetical protein